MLAAPRFSRGQAPSKVSRIAILWFGSMDTPAALQDRLAFRQHLATLGYVEGKNIVIEERSAGGNPERLREFAREFAARKVDVIVTPAVTASRAARQATSTIPIVMVHAGNPVGAGLIADLARPGGNVTGTTNVPLGGKHVDLIRELTPLVTKVAILVNPTNPGATTLVSTAKEAANQYGIATVVVEVTRVE